MLSLFWFGTVALLVCATFFLVPPLWLNPAAVGISTRLRATYSFLLVFLLVSISYFIYGKLGAGKHLPEYYSHSNIAQRQNYKLIRPLYARVQRELIKNELDLKLDLENLDLILNFAQIHSQSQNGVLQSDVQKLLQAVLRAVPQQVTALNLLAVNAYKTDQYASAIDYWQRILQQFTPDMSKTHLEQVLQDKITETKHKLAKQQNILAAN